MALYLYISNLHGIFRGWQQLTGNRSRFLTGEESPDCTEREVLFSGRIFFDCERRVLRTISRRKESATERKPPGFIPVRVKRRGKSPPGGKAKAPSHRQTPSAARPNRERVVARSVNSSGFWSHRQMIAAIPSGVEQNPAYFSCCLLSKIFYFNQVKI